MFKVNVVIHFSMRRLFDDFQFISITVRFSDSKESDIESVYYP